MHDKAADSLASSVTKKKRFYNIVQQEKQSSRRGLQGSEDLTEGFVVDETNLDK